MDRITAISVRLGNYYCGQTKTDFAMIMLAVSAVVYVAYKAASHAH